MAACRRWAADLDVSTAQVALALGLSARTVRAWPHPGGPLRRGRPKYVVHSAEGRLMRAVLLLERGRVGAATLHAWCPHASRRAVATWLRQYRVALRRQQWRVRWTRSGRVWAMDFSEPSPPIDGRYRYVLHVRDLASQYYLAALPVDRATGAVVCDLLRALCATGTAPLVLKVDNGAAFVSREVRAWANTAGTLLLYSPVACPRYNGSIEASVGAIATRAHHAAAAAGHPERWTCDDVETARLMANAIVRDPERPITATERRRFGVHYRAAIRHEAPATGAQQRTAIVHTLTELGYVSITRRADLVH